ncbi:MAG: hypothetical protein ACREAA_22110 [Candidatus Polarisedimenticolia bacterium]
MAMVDRLGPVGLCAVLLGSTGVPALAQTSSPPATAPTAVSKNRLFLRFVQDSALVPSFWLEGQGQWLSNTADFPDEDGDVSDATLFATGAIFAMNVAEDFEFGGRLALAHRDPDDGGGDTGLTDTDLWGKVSVVTDPMKISVGVLFTLPTGSEDDFLGTGETNVEFFAGARKEWGKFTLAGNLGIRINQDADLGDSIELEGQNSLLGGVAMLITATSNLTLVLEYAIESERYEGLSNDARLFGGFDWSLSEHFMLRGGVGGGLSEGAPDFQMIGSIVWLF